MPAPAPVTDTELLQRCYAKTHEAADKVSALDSQPAGAVTVQSVTALRNVLRSALSAAQELKTRLKHAQKTQTT